MKRYLIISIAVLGCISLVSGLMHADIVFTPEKENVFIRSLKEKFDVFQRKIPQDRVYLHTDKTYQNTKPDRAVQCDCLPRLMKNSTNFCLYAHKMFYYCVTVTE